MQTVERRTPLLALVAVLLMYAMLGLAYIGAVPAWRGADELAHFGYVRHLALGRGLPVLGTRSADYPMGPSYEAHQPPLYYALGALIYRSGWGPEEVASLRLRVFSLVIGALVGLAAWLLAREVWPSDPAAWILSAEFVLLLPSQTSLFATVNNDSLTQLLFGLVLWLSARVLAKGLSARASCLLGALVGLAMLTKASAALLLVVVPLAITLAVQRQDQGRQGSVGGRAVVCLLAFFGAVGAVGGWWLWRNASLYGDPLGMKALQLYFRSAPSPEYFMKRVGLTYGQYWVLVASWCFRSSFAAFPGMGNRTLFLAAQVYWAYALSWAAALAGHAASRRRAEPEDAVRYALWMLVMTVLLLLGAHARLNSV
ncbi:MAG: hypothetical protein ACUVRO_06615, partial [Armatimonadota bacterium]